MNDTPTPLEPCPICSDPLAVEPNWFPEAYRHPPNNECPAGGAVATKAAWNVRAPKPTPAEPMERFTKAALAHFRGELNYASVIDAFNALTPEPGEETPK